MKKQSQLQKDLELLKSELSQLLPDITVLSSRRGGGAPTKTKSPVEGTHKIHTLSQLFSKAPTDEEYSSTL